MMSVLNDVQSSNRSNQGKNLIFHTTLTHKMIKEKSLNTKKLSFGIKGFRLQ